MFGIDIRQDALTIRAARLPESGDGLRARLSLERMLSQVDVPHPGLLVVQRMAVGQHAMSASAGTAFGQAVETRLAELRRRAARPWHQPSAVAAEAVLFADEAELLACLARDWLTGTLSAAWYWRTLFRQRGDDRLLRAALLGHCRAAHNAFGLLASEGLAVHFAARLTDDLAATLVTAMAEAFGVPATGIAAAPASVPRSDQAAPLLGGNLIQTAKPQAVPDTIVRAQAKLNDVVPELRNAELRPAQRSLLALALALERAPAWIRNVGFAVVQQPASETITSIKSPEPPRRPRQAVDAASSDHEPWAREASRAPAVADAAPDPAQATAATAADAPAPTSNASPRVSVVTVEAPTQGTLHQPEPEHRPATSPDHVRDLHVSRAPTPPVGDIAVDASVTTGFGGLFYLLNVALSLGLYGDFTQPRYPNLGLSPWDLLALAGRQWFGADFVADPVWRLLPRLSGRHPRMHPGTGFAPPSDWRLPDEWLDAMEPPTVVGLHVTHKRLVLLHPNGFALAQVSRTRGVTPRQQARATLAEIPPLCGATLKRCSLPRRIPRGRLAGWVAFITAAIAARLATALGVDAVEAPALLCRHAGVVRLGRGRVDIELELKSLPIEVRMAGLDRDPGWIPASGHAIAFRFT